MQVSRACPCNGMFSNEGNKQTDTKMSRVDTGTHTRCGHCLLSVHFDITEECATLTCLDFIKTKHGQRASQVAAHTGRLTHHSLYFRISVELEKENKMPCRLKAQ